MAMTDLGPAADNLCALIAAVPDSDLGRPTPCTDYTVGDLLHHIADVTVAFGGAAVKSRGESADMGPWGDASKLDPDWRISLPRRVQALAEAWRDPHAWTGITRVGGADQPGEMIGIFALGELVVHGWDLARGTGLPFDPDPRTLAPPSSRRGTARTAGDRCRPGHSARTPGLPYQTRSRPICGKPPA
jgi:uncharacterized protein (TIGR03086 family)